MWFFACFALFLFQSTIVQIHSIQRNITGDFLIWFLHSVDLHNHSWLLSAFSLSFCFASISLSVLIHLVQIRLFFFFLLLYTYIYRLSILVVFSPCTTFSIHFVLTNHLSFVRNRWIVYRTNSWGYLKNGTFDGMIGALVRKEIDVGGSPAFFRIERAKVIDYTARTWISR